MIQQRRNLCLAAACSTVTDPEWDERGAKGGSDDVTMLWLSAPIAMFQIRGSPSRATTTSDT